MEYPTVRELTEAAVLRIEEGLDGTLAFLLGITSDGHPPKETYIHRTTHSQCVDPSSS
jgi:hypothetical protein